ncbi:hypothetical protein ACJJTC_009833 [Scirpophaga incertulas]
MMKPKWSIVIGYVCILAMPAHPLNVAKPEAIVVTKAEDGQGTGTQATPSQSATAEPVPPIKLTEMEVTSDVELRYAHTAVVTTVRNPAKRAQETTFRVLLPETAFISGFTMILDGKPYKAYVKEKEEAKKIYEQAVSQGLGAAQVATKARDSNQFVVSVNVEPETMAMFNLTCEEMLARRNNVYNHVINLHPGSVVPKLTVTVNIREQQPITVLRVPEVRTGNEIDATAEDKPNPNAVIEKCAENEVTIVFQPSVEEQKRLMDIYEAKEKEGNGREVKTGVLGQFVVQYDVDRPPKGEILVNDGYFVHFFAPSNLPPLNKHVVFVLDTSGSMMGLKIVQLRQAMQTILSELNEGDYFSIVEFSSGVMVHELSEADKEPIPKPGSFFSFNQENQSVKLVPPTAVNPENVAKAKVIVNRLAATGGTNIYSALEVGVMLINLGIGWQGSAYLNNTSGEPIVTRSGPPTSPQTTAVAAEVPQLEPTIIFLTDGEPTVGITSPSKIISHTTEINSGPNKATIYSLAFGSDADRKFLRKLSLKNDGFMRHIYEDSDAALQLRDFYRQISSPLLADVKFVYPKNQIKEDSLTKHWFRRYYAGSETVVAGRVSETATELSPQVQAFCGVDGDFIRRIPFEVMPVAPVRNSFFPLERLWAYLTVKQLLDERDAEDNPDENKSPDSPSKKALAIALKYEFVTPLTSLVVVKPNATNAVDAESVNDKSVESAPFVSSGLSMPLFAPGLPGPSGSAPLFVGADYSDLTLDEDYANFGLGASSGSSSQSNMAVSQPLIQGQSGSSIASSPSNLGQGGNVLAPYHLEEYPWVRPLLDSANDALNVQTNSTAVTLSLTKGPAPKNKDGVDAKCPAATDGAAGVCVYLTRCEAAKTITADTYSNTYCRVDDKFAGVCCPESKVVPQSP